MSKRIILCLLILGLSNISASKSRGMREHRSGNTAAETPQSGRFKELGWRKNSCSKKKKRSLSRRSHVASAGINSASKSRGMREHRSGNTAAPTPQQESFKEFGWGKNSCSKKKKRQQIRRSHVASAGAGGAQLNFGQNMDEEEDEDWECISGSSAAQKSSTYISSEKMVHTKLQNVPSLTEMATVTEVKRFFKQLQGAAEYTNDDNPGWLNHKSILLGIRIKLGHSVSWTDKFDDITDDPPYLAIQAIADKQHALYVADLKVPGNYPGGGQCNTN